MEVIDWNGSGIRSVDAFGTKVVGRRDRCGPKRFRRNAGGTSGFGAGLESAKVGEAEGSWSWMLPFWRMLRLSRHKAKQSRLAIVQDAMCCSSKPNRDRPAAATGGEDRPVNSIKLF